MIAAGLAVLTLGLAVRPYAGSTVLFVALSAVALSGIALVNVLMPVIVKERFPDRVGTMTGLYSVALNVGATAAAAATVPLTGLLGGDWRLGLGAWALVAALAVPAWLPLARDRVVPVGEPRRRAGQCGPQPGRVGAGRVLRDAVDLRVRDDRLAAADLPRRRACPRNRPGCCSG